jgi:peptidoglycan/xylan/chitin deacetylase (PgdA/CDA1 family)
LSAPSSLRSPLQPLRGHQRFDYLPINQRRDYDWPGGARLAVYLGLNLEHFAFGEGLGARLGPPSPEPDVLNWSWREYGNRVGAWRCLQLFDQLALPAATLINTSLYDHCPELIAACVARGDELVGHGHTNSVRQGELTRNDEARMISACRDRITETSGQTPAGWLSPWISESPATPDLLAAAGYRYTLNWCHDDQPLPMRTDSGPLWAVPYPQELNDIPMIIARQMTAPAFADMILDQFEEMLAQSRAQPLVMGIALHPYIVGQPHRLRHLRRALESIAQARDRGTVWFTTPGRIYKHAVAALAA